MIRYFYRMILLLMLLITVILFPSTVSAASNLNFQVDTDKTDIYLNNSGTLEKVGELNKGFVFKQSDEQTYYRLIKFNNRLAYVKKSETSRTNKSINKPSNKYSVKQGLYIYSDTIVYDNSTGSYVPLGSLSGDQPYKAVLEQQNWWGIDIGGRLGFIHKSTAGPQFTPSVKYFKVEESGQEVFQRINNELVVVGELNKNQVFKRTGEQKYYHLINFGGKTSLVRKSNTSPATISQLTSRIENYKKQNRKIEVTEDVIAYQVRNGKYTPVAFIKTGQKFDVYVEQQNWWGIEVAGKMLFISKGAAETSFGPNDRYFEARSGDFAIYHNINGKLEKVGQLEKGFTYEIHEQRKDWHLIEFGNRLGYVKKSSTVPSQRSKIGEISPKNSNKLVKITKETVIFDNSKGSFTKIGEIYPEVTTNIVKESKNFWYINIGGRLGFIYKSAADNKVIKTTFYNLSFNRMLDIQMTANPKSDGAGRVSATRSQVATYLNPNTFKQGTNGFFQFLVLDQPTGVSAQELNQRFLKNAGSLTNQGRAFIEAAEKYGINELYLIAHTKHETGAGTSRESTLSKGISTWTKMKPESCEPVTDKNGKPITMNIAPKKVYNMYGISAYDDCPTNAGAQYAYDKGWFSPHAAIVGGAHFIKSGYIERGQNTLYKMRWDPEFAAKNNRYGRQYATHIQWAEIQARQIANMYSQLSSYFLQFDVPQYIGQPGGSNTPPPNNADYNIAVTYPDDTRGMTNTNVNLRKDPSTNQSPIKVLSNGTNLKVLRKATNGWYEVEEIATKQKGWVSGEYVDILNLYQVDVTSGTLNVRATPSTSGATIGSLAKDSYFSAVLDASNKLNITSANGYTWVQINYNGTKGWVATNYAKKITD